MNTRKKTLYIFGGLVILVLVVLFWPVNILARAGPTLRSILGWDATLPAAEVEAQPPAAAEFPTPSREEIMALPDATEFPTPSREEIMALPDGPGFVLTENEQLKRNEEVVALLEQLVAKAEEKYLFSGWLHTVLQTEASIMASAAFPYGDPIPTKYTSERWEYIDSDGYVDKSFSSQDTGDALTTNTAVYQDGVVTNFGLEETWEQEKYRVIPGSSLLEEMQREKDKIVLEVQEIVWQGTEALALSLTYRHSPIDMNPELSPEEEIEAGVIGTIAGTIYTHYLSAEDGHFVGYEMSFIYPDGQVKLATWTRVTVFERFKQPPPDILAYFK